jgi:outer membrane protein TolC
MVFYPGRPYLKTMKTKVIALTALLITLLGSVLSAETVLALEDAVSAALSQNLSLTRSRIDLGGKQRSAERSWSSLVPSLSAGASVSHATTVIGELNPLQDAWIPSGSFSAAWTFSLAQISGIEKARAEYEAGLLSYEGAKQELELQVRKLFYQMLLLRGSAALMEQNIATAQSRYEQTAALARLGQASTLDELSARVDWENLKPNLKSAETQYANALDSFKQILGLPPEETLILAGSLEDLAVAAGIGGIGDLPEKQESWTSAALLQSLQVMEAQKRALWNQAYLPTIRLSWSTAPAYRSDTWADAGSLSAGISLSLDSFMPWSSAHTQIETVDDSIRDSGIRLTESVMDQELKIRQYTRLIEQSLENLTALALNVELAERSYEMYEEAYRRGAADLQRLRSAGDSLSAAQNKVEQERYTLLAAILDLEKALNVPFGTL